jgi:excinuclease ABC subunit C
MPIDEKLKSTPAAPGVYTIRDTAGKPIYVGKAKSLRDRLRQHFRDPAGPGPWHEVMISRAADFDYVITRSPREALLLESTLIKQHQPRFNINLTDDKSYPYLMLTQEPFPRLVLLRDLPAQARPGGKGRPVARALHDPKKHRVHRLGEGDIFGPYTDARAMRRAAQLASRLFGLRSCRKALEGQAVGTPCLNYHIQRCVGACSGQVTREQYAEIVRQVRRFLGGETGKLLRDLRRQMQEAAAAEEYERAAVLRDRIEALERATRDQVVVSTRSVEQDVAAVATTSPLPPREGGGGVGQDLAIVALLRVRYGRLVGHEEYLLRAVAGHSPAEILEAFLTQHYGKARWAPRELLLPVEVAAREEWEQALSELRGSGVTVRWARRGAGRRLLEMAQANAEAALARAQALEARKEGAASAALEDLAALVGLDRPPARIEGFDISNVQGDHAVASMVVFIHGQPDKPHYRRFRMRTPGPDDFAMLAETLRRRLTAAQAGDAKFLPRPDLIMVDGGEGQVSAARRVLEEMGEADLALVGLAKREEEVYAPGRKNPLPAEEHPAGWYLLQRVRDEAHRFAVTYHRGVRGAAMLRSELEQVPGLGPRRRQALQQAFPSLREMAGASEEELAAVPGMNRMVARRLKEHLISREAEGAVGEAQHS